MQMNVIRGEPMTGKSTRLLQIHRETCLPEQKILRGVHCTTAALIRKVREYASQGATVICIDECSEEQIGRLKWLRGELAAELQIHAVVGI